MPAEEWVKVNRQIVSQLDIWCRVHHELPPMGTIRCGACSGGMAAHWRSTGAHVKVSCLNCRLEVHVSPKRSWRTQRPPPVDGRIT